ncbi:hypothetical protein ACIBP6_40590 [Nonomuraea terrae]|uniref:hypothetical protein n=1 Tax=Nonomuraea terrae TaxID=2530383 RepID=UPI003798E750
MTAHALLVIALVVGAVFTHGGACAAVELAESASHSAHAEWPDQHDGHCLHSSLPEHHRHGTEQDCSASGPAGSTSYVAMPAELCTSVAGAAAAPAPSAPQAARLAAACLGNLCVMRI